MKRWWLVLLMAACPLLAQPPTPASPLVYPQPNIEPKKPSAKPGATPATAPVKTPSPARAAAPAGPSYKDLRYTPLRAIPVPQVDTTTLANGLRIYLLEDHELPLVNGTALVHTGTLLDPPGKVGLANLALTVMRTGGAGTASASQVNARLEDLAGTVETAVSPNNATVSFSSLTEGVPEVLAIFKEVLTAPQFSEDKIDEARTQMRNAISHRNEDAGNIAQREIAEILFGRDTPFGREQQYATVGNILRSDLQTFHARYFFPKNTLLAIRGDFDTAQMKARLAKLFGDWTADQPPVEFPKPAAAPGPEAAGIHVAPKKDITQTYFAIGQISGLLNDKDYAALAIMADILGGSSPNRLMQRLRGQSSRTTVTARWDAGYDLPGLFAITGTTEALSIVDTLKAVQEEVARIRSSEVSEEELKIAKDTALNSLVFAFDTKAKTLNRLLTYEYYGYPADFIDRYQKALEAVTRADVLRVAKERLKPEAFTTVVVGDPNNFIPPVESLNLPVHPIDLTIPEPKMTASKPDAASLAKGKAMLARLQQAIGGLDKLSAVKDSTLVAQYVIDSGSRVTPVKHTERWMAPMHYREDNELGGGVISSYFDGQYGWISVPGGTVPLSGLTLKQVQGNLFRQYQLLLQGGTLPGTSVNAVDDQTIEVSGPFGQWARVVVDPATGMPLKIRYEGVTRSGPPPLTEESWSDFKEVDGLKVPSKITIMEGGRKYADVTISDYRLNSGLKLADLEKRP
ncbi:MAG TPA: insulinase family protein [Bryobacteraceae bacterium]|nr:insulinase family protein [Bryobacteraceae bacterium]